jgi:predicted permease
MNDTTDVPIDVDQELYPALIQCFFIISAGYVAGQLNIVTKTQSVGLSRFISDFALPAVIFKNLVDVQFRSVSWLFLASVFLAKAIVFISTAILAAISERPRNFGSMGLYAIMTSQSNDFALILPIIDAVYKQSHPDYQRYIYLIAPISLVILNPIGFFLIEIQKRLDDQKKRPNMVPWTRCNLIRKILYNIARNPIVICTILGVIFNRIFNEHLPDILERILTPIAQSFSATALFYLGLTMVGKLRHLHAHLVITVLLLSMIKLIICPLILRQAVFLLVKPKNGSLNDTIDYSNFGFLYGTAPIAPSIIFYVPESNAALQAIAATGLVVSTLLAGPIMLISAKMINLNTLDPKLTQSYEATLLKTSHDVSVISLFCTIIVLIGFILRRRLLTISFIHKYTFIFVGLQMIHAIWTIGIQFITLPISPTATIVVNLGKINLNKFSFHNKNFDFF